ncbi:hypothetical protein [Gordonia hirsuta]|nr:hypothetical protein [Gordonia hirsuta]
MQVLFSPSTRDFGPDGAECGSDPEMFEALDVFTATALISPAAARAAKAGIDAGQSDISGISGRRLKAV